MKTSAAGRAFLTKEEGLRLKAYRCSAGVLTIGVGHTSAAGAPRVTADLVITREQADEILSRDLVTFEDAVNKAIKVPVSQNEYDAMVSLAFNIGTNGFAGSSVVRKLNAGDRAGAAEAFLLWKRAGDHPTILLARRQREKALFLSSATPVAPKAPKAAPAAPVAVPEAPKSRWSRFLAWLVS